MTQQEDMAPIGVEALPAGLRKAGITHPFANSGTNFPKVIEAMATLPPEAQREPVLAPHETAGVAMAHVNVGPVNSVMGPINKARDEVAEVMMSGRGPITGSGHPAARVTPIQCGREMDDQNAMIAGASRAHAERVLSGADLPAALERTIAAIRGDGRQAVLEVAVALSDVH